MSNSKRSISVILSEQGVTDLKDTLSLWLKINSLGHYVNCKSVDPAGVYFHMFFDFEQSGGESLEFEVQIPHHYVKAIVCAKDLTKLGFV